MILFFAILLGSIVIDQLSKWLVVANMQLGDSIPVLPKILDITYSINDGAAFGMLDDSRWVFMIFSTVAIAVILFYVLRYRPKNPWILVSLSMIAGGGVGNMIDRVRLEYVIDFIDCSGLGFPWIFNFADAFVCVGCGLMIFDLLREIIAESKAEKAAKAAKEADASGEKNDENGN